MMQDFRKTEESIFKFWKKNKIFEKMLSRGQGNYFVLDGPPYANGIPHVGHIKNTVLKDLIIRVALMKGKKVLFQPGFDTHGLPIENKVEKKLNLKSKKDIEKLGISKFMEECKKNATLNKNIWMRVYEKIGSLYFLKEPYLTYDNDYIESAWWAFSEIYKKGLVYEGEKPVMWCPHCETSLAGYEVTDSYKDVNDPGAYVLFKLKNSDKHLLVYTTTPWTLPANVAIAVAPKENYVVVEKEGRKIVVGEGRVKELKNIFENCKIIEKIKGAKLVGGEYEPLLEIPLQEELSENKLGVAHKVIASIPMLKERVASKLKTKKSAKGSDLFEEFVTIDTGTGIVHVAPGHGKTDYVVGQHYKLACVSPVDDQGKLMKDKTTFSGFVKDADKDIIDRLEKEGKLLYKEIINHSYPLCWRCKSPLIFRLSEQLFFKIDKIKKNILKETEKVKWYPEFAKERFHNWVAEAEDWNISRQRYWGIPIPLWKSADGEHIIVENKEQLEKLVGKEVKDLHTVEGMEIKKDGKVFQKVRGILDVWFDSGVAPWASMGYPKKNKQQFLSNFPVSRINEAQDQIRGWFYSLMFSSVGVFGKAPYKEVSMAGWVLDKKGEKMSKSLGNVVEGEWAVDMIGADILRYYFCWDVAPYDIQKFNMEIAKKEVGRILNVLWNLQNLSGNEKLVCKNIEDKWIISRMNSVIKNFEKNLEVFEIHTAVREISNFILNDLSRTYIRMTREKENRAVISYCLEKILKLLAPIVPFITEKIWQNLREKKIVKEESVHLSSWPKADDKKIDKKLEEKFDLISQVIEKGLAQRDKIKVGLKWPLSRVIIQNDVVFSKEMEEIIRTQLNVKKVEWKKGDEVEVQFDEKITSELEAEGYARELSRQVQEFRKKLNLNKRAKVNLRISVDADFKKTLEKNLEMVKDRTNAKELEIISSVTTDKERFKNKTNFKIKDKEGVIWIDY